MAAIFKYVSGLSIQWVGDYELIAKVDIQNQGDTAGECTATFQLRQYFSRGGYWIPWQYIYIDTSVLQPGQTRTFSALMVYSPPIGPVQVKVESLAGKILEPPEPKEFICTCCGEDFDTQEELDAHWLSDHPEYTPMLPLTHFTLKGLSWPDHFYLYGEDYGKIINWYAIACTDEHGCPVAYGWSLYVPPDDGEVYRDVSLPCHFTMPSDWLSAHVGPCGYIPNTTKLRLFFETDLGWTGWLGDSPWLQRIPDGATITFDVDETGCRNWQVQPPELQPQFSGFAISDYRKV